MTVSELTKFIIIYDTDSYRNNFYTYSPTYKASDEIHMKHMSEKGQELFGFPFVDKVQLEPIETNEYRLRGHIDVNKYIQYLLNTNNDRKD